MYLWRLPRDRSRPTEFTKRTAPQPLMGAARSRLHELSDGIGNGVIELFNKHLAGRRRELLFQQQAYIKAFGNGVQIFQQKIGAQV